MSKFITCIEQADSFASTQMELDFALEQMVAPVEEGFGDKLKKYAKIAYDKFMELIKIISDAIDKALAAIKKFASEKILKDVDLTSTRLYFNEFREPNMVWKIMSVAFESITELINDINRKDDWDYEEGKKFESKLYFILNKHDKKETVGKTVKCKQIQQMLIGHQAAINKLSNKVESIKQTIEADSNAKMLRITMNQMVRFISMIKADVTTLSVRIGVNEAK